MDQFTIQPGDTLLCRNFPTGHGQVPTFVSAISRDILIDGISHVVVNGRHRVHLALPADLVPVERTALDLLPFGYAPGSYDNECRVCGTPFPGDKRARRCYPCANDAYAAELGQEIATGQHCLEIA